MNCILLKNENLAPYCSMRVGGTADYVALPKNIDQVIESVSFFRDNNLPGIAVGNCSNLIFADHRVEGVVIVLTGVKGCLQEDDGLLCVACGETLSSLAAFALEKGLAGFEFCYGIPGTVGGGVFMNAGAYGGEISSVFEKGEFLTPDGEIAVLTKEEMEFGYRKSVLMKNGYILLRAWFSGSAGDRNVIRDTMDGYMQKRKNSQPLEYPSCGSTFKRPEGYFAGALIEQCGLKGVCVGGAEVSVKHAGFVINKNNATVEDVLGLIALVQKKVKEETGVTLEPEVRIIKKES